MAILAATGRPEVPPERVREVARVAEGAGLAELWLWEASFRAGAAKVVLHPPPTSLTRWHSSALRPSRSRRY